MRVKIKSEVDVGLTLRLSFVHVLIIDCVLCPRYIVFGRFQLHLDDLDFFFRS